MLMVYSSNIIVFSIILATLLLFILVWRPIIIFHECMQSFKYNCVSVIVYENKI